MTAGRSDDRQRGPWARGARRASVSKESARDVTMRSHGLAVSSRAALPCALARTVTTFGKFAGGFSGARLQRSSGKFAACFSGGGQTAALRRAQREGEPARDRLAQTGSDFEPVSQRRARMRSASAVAPVEVDCSPAGSPNGRRGRGSPVAARHNLAAPRRRSADASHELAGVVLALAAVEAQRVAGVPWRQPRSAKAKLKRYAALRFRVCSRIRATPSWSESIMSR